MLFILLAYFGGILTILSPCILPVLPFVFARADRSFARSTLPLLGGMAATFALVATLAAVGGGWAVQANAIGRWAALVLLALFGIALVFPGVSDRLTRPLVALGSRLSERQGQRDSIWSSAVLGIATGLLWAPCAGPILGIIFTAAALQGASFNTTLLLLAYALGAATSLGLALLVGGKVFARMKKSLGASERIRQVLGVLVLIGVAAIALGLDTRVLARLSSAQTASLESGLARRLGVGGMDESAARTDAMGQLILPVEGALPPLDGLGPWFNSAALTPEQLRGKVVVVDFWTYSCINCLRSLPYIKAWDEKYRKDGLVVIGVHAPEFAFEREPANVAKATADLGIRYPVALDNQYRLWSALDNHYWPAHYFVDAQGRIRYHHFGEGDYAMSERVIRQLLAEAGHAPRDTAMARATGSGAEAAAALGDVESGETYIGYARAANFASPGGLARDQLKTYAPAPLELNHWALDGPWLDRKQSAVTFAPGSRLSFRFHARDLHLVLGPAGGKPVRFRVTLDGQPPSGDAGGDVAADGSGVIREQRLYQLVRQQGAVRDRTFTITFLDPGAEAFAFTFG
jgi:cytochrome c biogenesis protein CcdA/thiol-disulfide isomerase/thioredoxin